MNIMPTVKNVTILEIVLLITATLCSKSRLPQHGYMTQYHYSQRPIYVNESMVLELTNRFLTNTPATHYLSCDVIVMTFSTHKLFLHFEAMKISSADKDIDRLHIYDYKESGDSFRVSPPQGFYGLYDITYNNGIPGGVNDYMSSGNRLRLDYQGKPTLAYDGFKILITSIREARGDCGHGYVQCHEKPICVPVTTWCDGHHNCGNDDHSDEVNCDHSSENKWTPIDGLTTAGVVIAASCTAFVLAAGVITLIIIRGNKRDEFTANVSIEFRKKHKLWQNASGKREKITRLYSPPSYEVIGISIDPPSYQSVKDEYETSPQNEQNGTVNSKEFEQPITMKLLT